MRFFFFPEHKHLFFLHISHGKNIQTSATSYCKARRAVCIARAPTAVHKLRIFVNSQADMKSSSVCLKRCLLLAKQLRAHKCSPPLHSVGRHHEAVELKNRVWLVRASRIVTEKYEKSLQHFKTSSLSNNRSFRDSECLVRLFDLSPVSSQKFHFKKNSFVRLLSAFLSWAGRQRVIHLS